MAKDTIAEDKVKEASEPAPTKTRKKKKSRRSVGRGRVYVLASFNNTIVSVVDTKGNTLTTASAGSSGFRGSKKGTAYAAQVAAEKAITTAKQSFGVNKVDVYVRGIGLGREAAIRTLVGQKIEVGTIKDITSLPHGGVRPRRAKRN